MTVDSKVDDNPGWGNDVWTGGVLLDRSRDCHITNVRAVNTMGDGMLIVTSEHVTVEKCEGANNTHHGIHIGSHSPWSTLRNCVSHDNGSDGIYHLLGSKGK